MIESLSIRREVAYTEHPMTGGDGHSGKFDQAADRLQADVGSGESV
jgi:hypothetical protein